MRGLADEAATAEPQETVESSGTPSTIPGDEGVSEPPGSRPTSELTGEALPPPPDTPPLESAPSAPRREPRVVWLTAAARLALILSVVVAALVLLAQFTFKNDWVIGLLRDNTLPPEK